MNLDTKNLDRPDIPAFRRVTGPGWPVLWMGDKKP